MSDALLQDIIGFARAHLSDEGIRLLSSEAFRLAGESQKATAIPALVLVASASLLVVVGWIALVTWAWRWRCMVPRRGR